MTTFFNALCLFVFGSSFMCALLGAVAGVKSLDRWQTPLAKIWHVTICTAAGAVAPWLVFGIAAIAVLGSMRAALSRAGA